MSDEWQEWGGGGAPVATLPTIALDREVDRIARMVEAGLLGRVRRVLEERGLLRRISGRPRVDVAGLAVDTGFTDPPLELTGGKLLIVLRAHFYFGSGLRRVGLGRPRAEVKGFIRFIQEGEGRAYIASKIVERKLILKVLREKERRGCGVDIILVDGELFPRVLPPVEEDGVSRLHTRYLELTREVLELADKTDTAVVGVLKRVYGYDIQALTGIFDVEVNDKALATYILEQGEWLYLKTYGDVEVELREATGSLGGETRRRVERRHRWIRAVIDSVEQAANIHIVAYKAPAPAYFMLATKIEVWPSMTLPVEDVVSYLAGITGVNGVPHPIDVVDSMARVTPELLHAIQQQLYLKVSRRLGDEKLALSIAGLTNPEKLRVIGVR